MTSNTEICNVALTRVDRDRITNLTDGSTAANDCNAIFVQTREALLRGHDWNFAREREKLARLTAAPVDEFDHAYQLPTDWLTTRRVRDNDNGAGTVFYRMQGSTILTSVEDVYLTYTRAVTNAAEMPPDFRDLFSYKIAEQVGKTSTLREEMRIQARRSRNMATSTDAIEDGARALPRGSWVGRRFRTGGRTLP